MSVALCTFWDFSTAWPRRSERRDAAYHRRNVALSLRWALSLLPFQELSEQRSLILRAQVVDGTAILAQEAVERTRIYCRRGGVGMFSQPLVSGFKTLPSRNLDVQTRLGPFRVTRRFVEFIELRENASTNFTILR